jgi:hypothetical protein
MDFLRFSFENRSALSGYTDSINPIEILYIFSREIAIPCGAYCPDLKIWVLRLRTYESDPARDPGFFTPE